MRFIDRDIEQPPIGELVLAWGNVPTIPGSNGSMFLGTTRFVGGRFDLDNTGHCGLVRVTHWSKIIGPSTNRFK